ncbi:MAG: hypothetical protein ACE5EF_08530, partial [Dehalococcoidia bacterium]
MPGRPARPLTTGAALPGALPAWETRTVFAPAAAARSSCPGRSSTTTRTRPAGTLRNAAGLAQGTIETRRIERDHRIHAHRVVGGIVYGHELLNEQ